MTETYLDRLEKFDIEWEVKNCLRSPRVSQSSDSRSHASSEAAENRKRKRDNSINKPIDVDAIDLMDHSIEVDFSSELSDSDSLSSVHIENCVKERPQKKRRLSDELPAEKPKPDLQPEILQNQMLTTTVTTPTAIITISSPSAGVSPVVIQNEQVKPEQIEPDAPVVDQTAADEEKDEAPESENEQKEGEEGTTSSDTPAKSSSGALKTTAKVAAWIVWSGLLFTLGRLADPDTIASILP